MKMSKKIITSLKKGGVNFYLSVPCKLLANMIEILENGELSDYQKLMEEKPILLSKLLREYFVNGNQLNDEKDIDKINEETIKHYG